MHTHRQYYSSLITVVLFKSYLTDNGMIKICILKLQTVILYSQNTGTDLDKSPVQLDSSFLAVLNSIQSFEFRQETTHFTAI